MKNDINHDFPCCTATIDLLIDKALRQLTSRHRVLSAGNIVSLIETQYGREAADKVLNRLMEDPPEPEPEDDEDDDFGSDMIIAATGRQALQHLGTCMLAALKMERLETEVDFQRFESAVLHRYGDELGSGILMSIYSCSHQAAADAAAQEATC